MKTLVLLSLAAFLLPLAFAVNAPPSARFILQCTDTHITTREIPLFSAGFEP